MTEDAHTRFAMAAMDFAGLFNTAFEEKWLGRFQIRMTEPEGQSTGGGIQALQHVTLTDASENTKLVIAAANTSDQTAEVRSSGQVASLYQKRYGKMFSVDPVQYNDLQQKLVSFFQSQSYQVTVTEGPKQPAQTTSPPASDRSVLPMVVGALAAMAAVAAAVYYLLK